MSTAVVEPSTLTTWEAYIDRPYLRPPAPMSTAAARAIPGVARGLSVIAGMAKQMPLDDYRGAEPLPRPTLLDSPDPDRTLPWWLDMQVQDFLLNGNAVSYVTAYDASGWPASCAWVPAAWLTVVYDPTRSTQPEYWVGGRKLDRSRVIHVQRGADEWNPWRGIGAVEQHLRALGRVVDQEQYESEALRSGGVPSVAVIAPNQDLSQVQADAAAEQWQRKYGGPQRRPAVLPNGTQVIPLSWNPSDGEMVEARKLSLLDVANILNLDGYWLGAPAGNSLTYRTPGPLYLNLLRQTVNPILVEFEGAWSKAWLPRGRKVQFDRLTVLRDDLATQIDTAAKAVGAKLWTMQEARAWLGLPPGYPVGHDFGPKPDPTRAAAGDVQGQDEPTTAPAGTGGNEQ